jgi:tRNA nucleotidyltransferase (CCA-adding enzyme)
MVTEARADELLDRLSLLPAAGPLLDRLRDADGVYLVGGAVRDLLLGVPPLDLDLVIDGELEHVTARIGAPVRSHDRFDTCTVVLDGFSYDLARARRERYPRPGALPTVVPATIEEDLGRRDFTVNALALGLGGEQRGRLVSAPHGREDLRRHRLRVLHDASFRDDPTRLLRLARYANRLGFPIEEGTRALAAAAVTGGSLATVSGARIGTELRLLAGEPDPVGAFLTLAELGVDEAITPGFGIRDPGRAELARRALALAPADGHPADIVMAVAAMDVRPEQLPALLDGWGFTAARRERIVAAALRSPAVAQALAAAARPSEIAAAARGGPVELVSLAGALGAPDAAGRWLEQLRHVRLAITGEDLLEAGVARGPAIGAGLAAALAAKLDGCGVGRAAELAEALRAADTP